MTKIVCFAAGLGIAAAALAQDAPKQVEYLHRETGFVFQHPADWKLGKRRTSVFFTAPWKGGTYEVELFGLVFSGTTEVWQIGQKEVNKQLKRNTTRQWVEELLGCPLLITQSEWADTVRTGSLDSQEGKKGINIGGEIREADVPMRAETGILYAHTPRKFVYRLTAPAEFFDDASYQWKQALLTLKTDDGIAPKPFDPDSKPTPDDLTALRRPPTKTVLKPDEKGEKPAVKAPQTIETSAAGKKVILRYPNGWKAKAVEGGFEFTHPNLEGVALVEALSTADSPAPGKTLIRYSAKSLDLFKKTTRREEKIPERSTAGHMMAWIQREGQSETGFIASYEAVGMNAAHEYWTVRWTGTDQRSAKRQFALLLELSQLLGVEGAE